MNLVVSSKHSL
jgi:secreted Zn-dependent insulinase-like peptidase